MSRSAVLLPFLLVALTIGAVACAPPKQPGVGDSSVSAALTATDAIRGFDFATAGAVTAAARFTNSTPDIAAMIYADVTGDGQEEAIVPFTTGGSQGYVLYQVYRIKGTGPELILSRSPARNTTGGIRMTVPSGVLTETAGVFANEDPLCCPSQLRQTTFKWDGSKMDVAGETVVANPNAPKS